jgi:hypothetical protein
MPLLPLSIGDLQGLVGCDFCSIVSGFMILHRMLGIGVFHAAAALESLPVLALVIDSAWIGVPARAPI